MKSMRDAFESFMQYDFYACSLCATRITGSNVAGSVSDLFVELRHNGTYRILWRGEIGLQYTPQDLLMEVPTLTHKEWEKIHGYFGFKRVLRHQEVKIAVAQGHYQRVERYFRNQFKDVLTEF